MVIQVGQLWRRKDAPGIQVRVTALAPVLKGGGADVVWFKTPRCEPTWLTPGSFQDQFEHVGDAPKDGTAWDWLDR